MIGTDATFIGSRRSEYATLSVHAIRRRAPARVMEYPVIHLISHIDTAASVHRGSVVAIEAIRTEATVINNTRGEYATLSIHAIRRRE